MKISQPILPSQTQGLHKKQPLGAICTASLKQDTVHFSATPEETRPSKTPSLARRVIAGTLGLGIIGGACLICPPVILPVVLFAVLIGTFWASGVMLPADKPPSEKN